MFGFIYLHKSFTALSVSALKQGVETEMANVR